jgi:hypothetical protein
VESTHENARVGCEQQCQWEGLPKPIEIHVTSRALDANYGAIEFSVCPAGFWSCFGLILPGYSFLLEWNFLLSVPLHFGTM